MSEPEKSPWQIRFERERKARKESEALLEEKSLELWKANQKLEIQVEERTESLKQALLKAEKADRAKSDFLANMSHEIRTPLNAIVGFSQFLNKSDVLDEHSSKYASIIESSAMTLLSIINDILDFSKIESGNFEISNEDCNIHEICENTLELFSPKIEEKKIELKFNLDKNVPKYVTTDGLRLKQVLSNLLSNAIKFTEEKGKVTFSIQQIALENNIATIKFEVMDTGIGIPKEKIENIFKPFIQLENISNKQNIGTGLGLSICSNILKLMNSHLNIQSEIDIGTTFSFKINVDLCQDKNLISQMYEFDDKNIQSELNGKILVAEDNEANQELIKLLLNEMDVPYTIASDGQEALDLYTNDPSYDLILMDINMPRLNGIESFYLIRDYEEKNELPETPVVALTANAIKGDEEKFLSLGMNHYISKPINVNKLKKITSLYLNSKEEHIEETIEKSNTTFDIEKISKKLGISENICEMLISRFKTTINKDMDELKEYVENGNIKDIRDKAHYIKNSCLNLDLSDEIKILQEIESEDLNIEEIKQRVKKLEETLLA